MASSEPPPHPPKKMRSRLDAEKNLGSPTHTWKTSILSFYIEQLDSLYEKKNIVIL